MSDLRHYSRQTRIRLIVGFFLILTVVGTGLIYLIYGGNAAFAGLTCILVGMVPILLIGLALWVIGFIVKRVNKD